MGSDAHLILSLWLAPRYCPANVLLMDGDLRLIIPVPQVSWVLGAASPATVFEAAS